jgi:hypothetical protein
MPHYNIGSITAPTDTPGEARVTYFAKLPLGGEVIGEIGEVIEAIEKQYAEDHAWKLHVESVQSWLAALTARARYWDKVIIELAHRRLVAAQILDALFGEVVETYDTEEAIAAAVIDNAPEDPAPR